VYHERKCRRRLEPLTRRKTLPTARLVYYRAYRTRSYAQFKTGEHDWARRQGADDRRSDVQGCAGRVAGAGLPLKIGTKIDASGSHPPSSEVCLLPPAFRPNHLWYCFGAWDGQPRGNHAENQNTGTPTTQSHSARGNACSPDASPCVCSDHPFDESSALQAADPKRIPVRNVSRPNCIAESNWPLAAKVAQKSSRRMSNTCSDRH
jgi:hypothetical protein